MAVAAAAAAAGAGAGVGTGAGNGETGMDTAVEGLAASFTRSFLERSTPFPIPSLKKNRLTERS